MAIRDSAVDASEDVVEVYDAVIPGRQQRQMFRARFTSNGNEAVMAEENAFRLRLDMRSPAGWVGFNKYRCVGRFN